MAAATFELALPELGSIERHRPQLLAVELHAGQRPLLGLAEQVDWRLGGLLSRWIAAGRIDGRQGERVLLSPGRHVRCEAVLTLGMGPVESCSSLVANRMLEQLLRTCAALGARSVAAPLPGRSSGCVRADVAAQLLGSKARAVPRGPARYIVVEEDRFQGAVARALSG